MVRGAGPPNPFVRSITVVLGAARGVRRRAALIGGFALPFHGVQRATGDVDFLLEAEASDAVHDALLAAGARCVHRSQDAANYAAKGHTLAPVDLVYARRERAREMLRRARSKALHGARVRVPVVDVEGIIGLKLQAIANAPARWARDQADIEALCAANSASVDRQLLRDYFRLFDREAELDRLLSGPGGD